MQWQPDENPRGTPRSVHLPSLPVTRPLREVMFGWVPLLSPRPADPPTESCGPVSAPAEPPGEMDVLDEL